MGASLSLTVKESDVDIANNTSKVTATLKIKATGATYNSYSRSGYITIDGTKYSFSSGFGKGKTTTLATKSKVVAHNADGSKTVTVKGYYSTGVSPGNLSKSKTITLTQINRNHTVWFNANGGSPTPEAQTKWWGSPIYLPGGPSRTGYNFLYWTGYGGTYYPGSAYYHEVDTTFVANWQERTYPVTYFNDNTSILSDTIRYTTAYNIRPASITNRTGYTLVNWKTTGGQLYSPEDTFKRANEDKSISGNKLYAVWNPNTSNISYDANGGVGNIPDPTSCIYDEEFTFPSCELSRDGYEFLGWSINSLSGSIYQEDQTITWNTDIANVTIYAIWKEIVVPIHYYKLNSSYSNFTSISSFNNFYTDTSTNAILHHDYIIPSVQVDNIENYTFSGYWTLGEPNQRTYISRGITFPTGIIPFDWEITEEDNFLTTDNVIQYLTEDVHLYAVYRDNTPSIISNISSAFEYVPKSATLMDYFKYLTGQINEFTTLVSSEYIVAHTKFRNRLNNDSVDLDTNSAEISLVSIDGEEHISTIFDIGKIYNSGLNTIDYYLLIKNIEEELDKTASYYLSISGIKDSFGKSIGGSTILIYPPKLIRDVNQSGNVFSLFTKAPDDIEDINLLLLDGKLSITNDQALFNKLVERFPDTYLEYLLKIHYDSSDPPVPDAESIIDVTKVLIELLELSKEPEPDPPEPPEP